jgi:hypothetical protein
VAAYSFDEGQGSTVTDLSGNGNDGALQNAAWTADGKFGGALVFNGANAKVALPATHRFDLTSGLTIEAWVDPTIVPSSWWSVVGRRVEAGSTTRVPTNVWTHLAVTDDGTSLKLYVNGVRSRPRPRRDPTGRRPALGASVAIRLTASPSTGGSTRSEFTTARFRRPRSRPT